MRDYKKHKLRFSPYLEKLYQSDKPMIIYKFGNKYKIFTDFSKKIILNKSNIKSFLSSFSKKEYKKEQDLFIGFFFSYSDRNGKNCLNVIIYLQTKLVVYIKSLVLGCQSGCWQAPEPPRLTPFDHT